jgi:tetratricopeptide (TPR) repeat protein
VDRRPSSRPTPEPSERGTRRRGPETPAAPREPIGRDRARGAGTPRRGAAPRPTPAPERPELPSDHRVELRGPVRKEVERRVSPKGRARDVLTCLDLGSAASERGDHAEALRLLRWAKHLAPRLALVREALGIALYRAEEFRAALTELQAYRRLAGSADQNHLVADCMRATGAAADESAAVALELVEDQRAEPARRLEAAIVAAAALEEAGQRRRARTVLEGVAEPAARADDEARARRHWFAAELAERDGDTAGAVAELDALLRLGPDDDAAAWRERLSPGA